MANDIFSRNVSKLGGVFTSDAAKLTLLGQAGQGNLGVLVQQLQFTYAQTITRLYEVGGANIYYVGGRTQGNMNVNRVIGPSGSVCAFYTNYGNVCNAANNAISLALKETDCSVAGGAGNNASTYKMLNCVITQTGVAVAAQDMIINENTAIMFSSLECS